MGSFLGFLTNKAKVNGEALIGKCSLAGSAVLVNRASLEFPSKADGTLVEDMRQFLELRNTINVTMSIVECIIMTVPQAFVPENFGGTSIKMMKKELLGARGKKFCSKDLGNDDKRSGIITGG